MISECRILAQNHRGRTILTECYFTPPYKIMRPFMNGSRTSVMLMTASAGILSGDFYRHDYYVGENADLTIESQGYTKIFRSKGEACGQNLRMTVEKGGTLRYLPHPSIPFEGSDYAGTIDVSCDPEGTIICSDIVACGRSGSGERFAMKRYASRMDIRINGKRAFLDNTLLEPEKINYESAGFFDGYTHMGTLYLYAPLPPDKMIAKIREQSRGFHGRCGVTEARKGILVRALADTGDEIDRLFSFIGNYNWKTELCL